jgi:hypothetical protein
MEIGSVLARAPEAGAAALMWRRYSAVRPARNRTDGASAPPDERRDGHNSVRKLEKL